jgi:D-xylose transport system substrate-binding protein
VHPDVRNVDAKQMVTNAEQLIKDGAKALIVAAPDPATSAAVAHAASAQGVAVVDYDPPPADNPAGSPADYALAPDYRKIGELQGRGVIRGVRSTDDASVIVLAQAPNEAAEAAMTAGQLDVLQPRFDAKAYRLVARQVLDGPGAPPADRAFDQLLAANGGTVNAVLAANDQIAAAVRTELRAKNLLGKVTVTGFGASPDALKAVLRGDQFMTSYLPAESRTESAAALASTLAGGDRAAADRMTVAGPGHARSMLVAPASITLDTIKSVFDSGMADSDDICTDELAMRCNQLSIS